MSFLKLTDSFYVDPSLVEMVQIEETVTVVKRFDVSIYLNPDHKQFYVLSTTNFSEVEELIAKLP